MTSSYGHVLERQPALGGRLDSPGNLDTLQAKKNFSVSHLLDLEEAGDMVAAQADESVGEAGRSLLESPGLTSGSDTPQQDSECGAPAPGRPGCPGLRAGAELGGPGEEVGDQARWWQWPELGPVPDGKRDEKRRAPPQASPGQTPEGDPEAVRSVGWGQGTARAECR